LTSSRTSVTPCTFAISIRARTRSTHFPYTTLFRSPNRTPVQRAARDLPARHPPAELDDVRARNLVLRCDLLDRQLAGRVLFADLDRKRTRLNSSHGTISYADVCLKKQKLSCS